MSLSAEINEPIHPPLRENTLQLRAENWGLIDYAEALNRQLELVEKVQNDSSFETLVFCQHPPVVTVGRSTKPEDVFGWKGSVYEVQRGGRATYHGPNQIVCYPILDLNLRGRDLHKYLRTLEAVLIETLKCYGIEGHVIEGATGVWVGSRKIASIGVGVKRWVSYHGIALNVAHDPTAFQGINPCGYSTETMVSMEQLLGRPVQMQDVTDRLCKSFFKFS